MSMPPQQQTLGGVQQQQWVGSRMDCMNDMGSCFYGFFCPCVMFGQTMERAGLMNCFGAATAILAAYIVNDYSKLDGASSLIS